MNIFLALIATALVV